MPVNTGLFGFRKSRRRADEEADMSSDAFVPDRERAAAADAQIPIIDVSPFSAPAGDKRPVVAAIARACEEVGFFGIVGHGVHEQNIAAIYREGRAFFALPREEKMEIARPAPAVSRGYNSLADQSLGNTVASGVPPDLQESFAIGPLAPGTGPHWTEGYGPVHFHPNLWPRRPTGFRMAVTNYYQAMEARRSRLRRCPGKSGRARIRTMARSPSCARKQRPAACR
jgi:isopenicillin N synthase-like dioxygenase